MDLKVQADKAIAYLKQFIDVEKQFIQKEHDMASKLKRMLDILEHVINERPDDVSPEMGLDLEIREKIYDIIELIESDRLNDLNFDKEEELFLSKLKKDMRNMDWRLVKRDVTLDIDNQDNMLRCDINEIQETYTKFQELVAMLKESDYNDTYFKELYNFAKSYEIILQDMLKKEQILLKQIKFE